ncbi:MAG: HAMP domain-containing histidine kinase [Lachnospiraceae bacterium]|nr:HAMP domain-containing histidine kinase [Lachnospiraceae bacterium]
MKQYTKLGLFIAVYFIIWSLIVYAVGMSMIRECDNTRAVFMNRMTAQIQESGSTDTTPFFSDFKDKDIASEINVYYVNEGEKSDKFGGRNNTYIYVLTDDSGAVTGFVEYVYESSSNMRLIILAELSSVIFLIPLIIILIYFDKKILKPFREFSDYPEKLSKGLVTEGLPESRDRFFGKYIWGMNMLGSKLDSDRKEIDRLLYDRKKFISTLAHGIKTPVANIKLYSEAIQSGLYRGGEPDPKDSEIAVKISRNADDIAELVRGILEDPGAIRDSFVPKISAFYLEDVKKRIEEAFDNRLKLSGIPFEINVAGNPLVQSDIEAIIRCITQFMENAIKYGDGTGIRVNLYRQDDITYFSVINSGTTLGEDEIPYVFNCYYRGTNSSDKEGSGIGLYEARSVARGLGGDIMMKTENNETEVIMYVPD